MHKILLLIYATLATGCSTIAVSQSAGLYQKECLQSYHLFFGGTERDLKYIAGGISGILGNTPEDETLREIGWAGYGLVDLPLSFIVVKKSGSGSRLMMGFLCIS